jgi:serine/threonine protein phosphatase PrpC
LQSQLSNAGGRLIIASDGIWDALTNEAAAKACRGLPAELAAKLVVKVILRITLEDAFVGRKHDRLRF